MQLTFYGSGVYIDTEALGGKALKLIKTHECYNAFETQVFDYIPLQGWNDLSQLNHIINHYEKHIENYQVFHKAKWVTKGSDQE